MTKLLEGYQVPPSNRLSTASAFVYSEQAYQKAYQIIDAATTYDEAYDFIKHTLEDNDVHVTELIAIYSSRLEARNVTSAAVAAEQEEKEKKTSLLKNVGIGLKNWICDTRSRLRADMKVKGERQGSRLGGIGGKLKRKYEVAWQWYTTGIEVLLTA